MIRFAITAGALLAGLSVALGAFGAHALADTVSAQRLDTWQTAAKYLMYHGQALILVGILAQVFKQPLKWTAILLFSGACIFSSSLFAFATYYLLHNKAKPTPSSLFLKPTKPIPTNSTI